MNFVIIIFKNTNSASACGIKILISNYNLFKFFSGFLLSFVSFVQERMNQSGKEWRQKSFRECGYNIYFIIHQLISGQKMKIKSNESGREWKWKLCKGNRNNN